MLVLTERWPRPETTGNTLQTTLAAAVTVTTRPVTLTPTSVVGWPAGNGFRVLIDTELLLVTYNGGSTWLADTVEGTTAATHLVGATVTQVLTSGALTQMVTDHAGATSATVDPHPMYVRKDVAVTEPAWHVPYAATLLKTAQRGRGYYVPAEWGANYKAARARALAGTGKCTIAVQGDSIAEGYFVTDLDRDSWPSLMQTAMQAAYTDGGSGWKGTTDSVTFATASNVPAASITWYTTHGYITQTGTWTDGGTYWTNAGPGGYYINTSVIGSSATFNVRGTSINIYTIQNGGAFADWSYSIDGAAPTTVLDAGSWSIKKTIVAASAGTHTVTIAHAGTAGEVLYLCGVSGENTTGLVVNTFCKNGEYSGRWNNRDVFGVGSWSGGTNYPCNLIMLACNANDPNFITDTGITLQAATSANASTIPLTGYLAPGWYTIHDATFANIEPVQFYSVTGSASPYTATVGGNAQKAHAISTPIAAHSGEPRAWSRNLRYTLDNVLNGPGATGTTDVMIVMPHIGTYDSNYSTTYQEYIREAVGLAEAYNAAIINHWALGNNSWNYWNNLGYWGDSNNPGSGVGTDGVHPNDAGHRAMWNAMAPILMAT